MRIVDRATFLALPVGTLFAKFGDPNIRRELCLNFGQVEIKAETIGNDFWSLELIPWPADCDGTEDWVDRMIAMTEHGAESGPLDYADGTMRDGLFDAAQQFAVFDRADAEALIARLQQALADGYGAA